MTTFTAPASLTQQLDDAHVPYELLDHPRTLTAIAEAEALGVEPRTVAKTVVLTTPDGFVRAVVPASEHVDLLRMRSLLGTKQVELATEGALAGAYPEFELGAVPPLGGADPVLVDRRLCETEWVLLEAGTHEQSLRLRTADLLTLADAQVADLCER
jgi:Ala-tRNA(Pro) deacylase